MQEARLRRGKGMILFHPTSSWQTPSSMRPWGKYKKQFRSVKSLLWPFADGLDTVCFAPRNLL